MNINKATLSLFNAIQVDSKQKSTDILLGKTIKHGFMLSPEIAAIATDKLISEISEVIGISQEFANSTFHKSWHKIATAPLGQLILEQMLHYMTTYGFEALGIYDKDYVYIPYEQLDIPEITENIKLTVIHGLTKEEILQKILDLGSGIALKTETLEAIMEIVESNKYSSEFVYEIKNHELKSRLFDYYDIVPNRPLDFLRYVVTKITGDSLLIKNKTLIDKIVLSKGALTTKTLDKLIEKAPENLSEIFYRYKPIFLALKKVSKNKTFFNQLRKKAIVQHKPMKPDFLNDITGIIKQGMRIDPASLEESLADVNIFRKIRLANALSYRLTNPNVILYKVRNGKGYVTDFENDDSFYTSSILEIVKESIAETLNVKRKKIYIPDYVEYAMPATEKMFTGNFPTGTYIKSDEDLVFGIHWFNTKHSRVDLDLSLLSVSGKIGWDRSYYNSDKSILFSGDITDAPRPNGATELFYLKNNIAESGIMMVNYFNFCDMDESEAKIIVSTATPKNFGRNYTIDASDILGSANIKFNTRENVLGLVSSKKGENRFYFANVIVGNGISSRVGAKSEKIRQYFENYLYSLLKLSDILEMAGADVVRNRPEDGDCIDLSPEALDKTTIINLLNNKI